MTRKVKKIKLNFKRTLAFFLFIYIFGYGAFYIINRPIRHIEIIGNENILDSEILRVSKLKDYPSIMKYSNSNIEKRIKTIKLVEDVSVKKWFGSTIKINVKENRILFYYKDKIVLSNGDIIQNDINSLYGIPTFTNEIENDILEKFVENFKKINDNIIYEMNEIEYYPLRSDDGNVISYDRFKILMNDGNTIVTNIKSVSVLNKYNDIFASIGEKKGTINLDSNEIKNLVFIPYEE